MRALGIDPGTKNFDLCCIEDDVDNVVLDMSISTEIVAENPKIVFEIIESSKSDIIVGPSGYGLEFKHISEFTDEDIALTTLDKIDDINIPVLSGLRKLLWMMKNSRFNVYSLPGVVLLPTIPQYRKINKIDMGTADKTCVAAFAIWDQAKEYKIEYSNTNLICVEMGFGYNAAMAVENGQIIDAIGGTIFPGPGYLSLGQMDGELAYLLGEFSKLKLFEAGATFIAANKILGVGDFSAKLLTSEFNTAWESLKEGIVKAVAMLQTSFNKQPQEIILTGRLSRNQKLFDDLSETLNKQFKIISRKPKNRFTKESKDVAQGAALLSNGIAGGKFINLLEQMKIKDTKGTVLDYVLYPQISGGEILKKLRSI